MTDQTVTTETPLVDPNSPSLNITDLSNALQIIDASVDRKTWGGWNELLQVKGVRDKLEAFLAFVAPKPEETEASADAEGVAEVVAPKSTRKKK